MVTLPMTLGDPNPLPNQPSFNIFRCLSYLRSGRT